jgi:hypothetical protein
MAADGAYARWLYTKPPAADATRVERQNRRQPADVGRLLVQPLRASASRHNGTRTRQVPTPVVGRSSFTALRTRRRAVRLTAAYRVRQRGGDDGHGQRRRRTGRRAGPGRGSRIRRAGDRTHPSIGRGEFGEPSTVVVRAEAAAVRSH